MGGDQRQKEKQVLDPVTGPHLSQESPRIARIVQDIDRVLQPPQARGQPCPRLDRENGACTSPDAQIDLRVSRIVESSVPEPLDQKVGLGRAGQIAGIGRPEMLTRKPEAPGDGIHLYLIRPRGQMHRPPSGERVTGLAQDRLVDRHELDIGFRDLEKTPFQTRRRQEGREEDREGTQRVPAQCCPEGLHEQIGTQQRSVYIQNERDGIVPAHIAVSSYRRVMHPAPRPHYLYDKVRRAGPACI